MKTLNLQQGSQEWLDFRSSFFTASEASAMMGASKYKTRDQLLHEKATGEVKEVDEFTQKIFDKGHQVEALARPIAEKIIGEDLFPVTGTDEDTFLLASFDGLTLMEDIGWECKQWNMKKAADVQARILPIEDKWQVIQQLIVSKAEKILYMITDGTEENTVHMWVQLHQVLFDQILSCWNQFLVDVRDYQPQIESVKPEAAAIMELPAINIEITGGVKNTNLAVYKASAEDFIASINTDLKTDEDFANAEKTVKFCEAAEKKLDAVKEQAISQTADIDELFKTLDFLKQQMRAKRLDLNKSVTSKKAEIKAGIIREAADKYRSYQEEINSELGDEYVFVDPDFQNALKGKKTVASLQSAANDEVARLKIEIDKQAKLIKTNLNSIPAEYDFLFSDLRVIAGKAEDDFVLLAKSRIAEYKEAEKAKAEKIEAEKIEAEKIEAEKIEAEKVKIEIQNEPFSKEAVSGLADIVSETPATNKREKEYEIVLTEEIKQSLIDNGIGKQTAQKVAKLIVAGKINNVNV